MLDYAPLDMVHDHELGKLRNDLIGPTEANQGYFSAPEIDVSAYDHVIVCMSGGKDSWASLLHLLDVGVPKDKIELWHHDVDGQEGSDLMDWTFMRSYNQILADTLGISIYFSWLEGGFEGEMLKHNSLSKPHRFESPEGLVILPRDSKRGSPGTRLKFPQVSRSLSTRWCSAALKIDVGRRALNNQPRFNGKKVLFVTGERRDEGGNRRNYNQFETHACDRRSGRLARLVDAWRPVLHWDEAKVWEAMERHRIIAPVPYRLGWGRSSCMTCIYSGPRVWATLQHYFPKRLAKIAEYERQFGTTISRTRIPVDEVAKNARPFDIDDEDALVQAINPDYNLPVVLSEGEAWKLPPGAFSKEGAGSN